MFKLSSIPPVFRSGCHNLISNYRPITIQSHISNIFEALILNGIQRPTNKILMDGQHGFSPGRSASTCNLLFSNYIFNAFQNQSQVHVIYSDFKKAFDSVDLFLSLNNMDSVSRYYPGLDHTSLIDINRFRYLELNLKYF